MDITFIEGYNQSLFSRFPSSQFGATYLERSWMWNDLYVTPHLLYSRSLSLMGNEDVIIQWVRSQTQSQGAGGFLWSDTNPRLFRFNINAVIANVLIQPCVPIVAATLSL